MLFPLPVLCLLIYFRIFSNESINTTRVIIQNQNFRHCFLTIFKLYKNIFIQKEFQFFPVYEILLMQIMLLTKRNVSHGNILYLLSSEVSLTRH